MHYLRISILTAQPYCLCIININTKCCLLCPDLPQYHCHYLWEFLHHILLEKENKYIEWKNKTRGVFRLKDHNGLARLWGKQKNRKNMTYEKLSRALRYYYSKDILQKVPGQRLTYKFVHNLEGKKYPL